MDLSIYGSTGIIGSYFRELFPSLVVPRVLLRPGSKRVLYLISTTDNASFKEDPLIDVNTNLVELMRRLNACREAGVKEFNFVSSWFVYGPTHQRPHEFVDCKPRGFYSITKYTAEQLVKEYCTEFGINYRILRLGNVYGGPDDGTTKRNALHFLINKIKNKESVKVMNYMTRDFIHILDTCRAIALVCSLGEVNTIYNIGTGKATELFEAVEYANDLLGSPATIYRFDPPNVYNQAIRFSLDCGLLNDLGFEPIFNIYQGLEDLCLHQKFCTPDRTLMEKKLRQQSKR